MRCYGCLTFPPFSSLAKIGSRTTSNLAFKDASAMKDALENLRQELDQLETFWTEPSESLGYANTLYDGSLQELLPSKGLDE